MRKFLYVLACLFVAFCFAWIFFLHWAIVTGRAKRQTADAEYHVGDDIRTIYHAQRQYYADNQYRGFTCTLSDLGGKPLGGGPISDSNPKAAQLLYDTLASGHADGYTFTLSNCKYEKNVGFDGYLTYTLTATPDATPNHTPRTFCVSDNVDGIARDEYVPDSPSILSGTSAADCTHPLAASDPAEQ